MSKLTVALMGNQNCGKTTLFNVLTGSNQYVGNWPGVTVDRVEGLSLEKDWKIIDLPGLYSLSPYSPEEIVTRDFLVSSECDVFLNVVDGSHLERALSLSIELLTFNKPMVIAVNMMDIVKSQGIQIDLDKLSNALGVEVVDISASNKEGFEKLYKAVENAKAPLDRQILSDDVFALITKVEDKVSEHVSYEGAKRFIALSLIQGDEVYEKAYQDNKELIQTANDAAKAITDSYGIDSQEFFAKRRYDLIDEILSLCRVKSKKKSISQLIDRVVLNRILALPLFFIVMGIVYFGAMYFTSYLDIIPVTNEDGEREFTNITDYLNDNFFGDIVSGSVSSLLETMQAPAWLNSFLVDGVISGVGAVLGFLPQIICLFLFLSFLEQSGYMTRVAFILDDIFRRFGLSGRNFIPMVIATGCGVPALMAHKTIDNINERRIGLITTNFIPCSAKLPIMTMIFASVFDGAWWFGPFVYFISILSIVVTGLILRKNQAFKEEVSPFVMEIPDYHLPTIRNIFKTVFERCKAFVIKAGTVILLVVIAVWFLSNFSIGSHGIAMTDNVDDSVLAVIGGAIAFIFIPVGFGSWQATVAVINGLLAKENVVSTLAVVLGLNEDCDGSETELANAISNYFASLHGGVSSPALLGVIGLSFLSFNLWSTPCVAALAAMKRQLGSTKWWLFAIAYMSIWSYSIALIIFRLGGYILGVVPFDVYTVIAIVVLLAIIYLAVRPEKKNKVSMVINSKSI